MPEKRFPMLARWEKRPDGSAWISVGELDRGPHYQCDFHGDMKIGPTRKDDFAYDPPEWVVQALNLQ